MRLRVASILLLLLVSSPVVAQRDCGNGLPCGRLPWDLPTLPVLPSPTPMPTFAITAIAPTQVSGSIPTPAPLPTTAPLVEVDTSGIGDSLATLGAVMETTPEVVLDGEGNPVDTASEFVTLGANAGQFFGYAQTVSTLSFGQMTPLITFGFLSLVIILSVKSAGFLLPVFTAIFGIVRKVISLILDFLPF